MDALVGDAASAPDGAVSTDAATSNETDGGGSGTADSAVTEMPDTGPDPCASIRVKMAEAAVLRMAATPVSAPRVLRG